MPCMGHNEHSVNANEYQDALGHGFCSLLGNGRVSEWGEH